MRIQSQHTRQVRLVAAMFLMGTLFFSCDQLAGPGSAEQGGTNNNEGGTNNNEGQLNGYSVSADGVNNETDSTALSFIFDKAVSDLGAEHIYIVNGTGSVTPGTLSGEGAVRSLEIGVVTAGNITVRIAKEGVDDAEKTLTVYKQGQMAVLSWTVSANGSADREDTVALTFTFSGAVPALSGDDIRIEQGTGKASAVDLTGNGQNWLLLIAVEQAGTINISINRDGIDPEYQRITVHKGYEAPPPERVGITVLSPPTTTYYGKNQTFNTAGLVVAWLYSDGSTEEIPASGYTVVRPNMTVYSPKAVMVRAGGFETSFNIQVVNTDKILLSITVSGPDNKVQEFGREFDKTGLVVTGHFSDQSTTDLSSLAAITGYFKFRRGTQTVAVNVNGVTAQIEDISTRIGEAAAMTVFTGYGVKTTFIKGETMIPEKTNISFRINPFGTNLHADWRELTLENGGLTLADYQTLTGYNPNITGKQTLSMSLDGRSFDIVFYVADAEPAVWFDFGYMRHAGDPTGAGKGAGIDNGKYYARANETLVIAPVRYLIGYNDDHSAAEVSYNWTVSGGDSSRTYSVSNGGEFLHITPRAEGTYSISVTVTGRNYITGSSITKSAQADVVCYTGTVSTNGKTFTSPLKNFGPGQMCEGGTGLGWSLGSAGGYEVWAVEPQTSYAIYGNAFGAWNEAGVVWMQEDRNGNGLPDEMWYELPGGEDISARKNQITRRYALTYYKTDDHGSINEYGQLIKEVYWVDAKGRTGMIPGGFPDKYWGVVGAWVTYTCTLLRDDGNIFFGGYGLGGLVDYVDTVGNGQFPVGKAVYADGTPVNLTAVKFLKVQTGIFRYGDIFGDVSTEISDADFLPNQSLFFPLP